jgi:UDP-N-acetylmuramoylalanine--D-glutamate ligase
MDQKSKIAVIGYGVEGREMLKYLVKHKYEHLTVCDQRVRLEKEMPEGVSVQLGEHYLDGLEEFDVVLRSPGVPHHNPHITAARVSGVDVTSPTQFFLDHCPCKVVGVTGTKGKGTTSTLIYEILKAEFGKKKFKFGRGGKGSQRFVYLGGNIGNPPIEFLDKLRGSDVVVLELSCFQLGDLNKSPAIAVLLNTTEDHLDYYPDVGEYMRAKELILTHQDKNDLAILNSDYDYTKYYKPLVQGRLACISPRETGKLKEGVFVDEGWINMVVDGKKKRVMRVSDVALIGSHNLENVCPAIAVGYEFGVPFGLMKKVIKKFKGLPHRLEYVAKRDGVSYYNDSFSTNPFTSMAAVDSFDQPTVLIAGGSDKGLKYDEWAQKILTRVSLEAVVLMGDTGEMMREALEEARGKLGDAIKGGAEATPTKVVVVDTLEHAVEAAGKLSRKGGVVVMSPAAASFDQFENYKERGKEFANLVL